MTARTTLCLLAACLVVILPLVGLAQEPAPSGGGLLPGSKLPPVPVFERGSGFYFNLVKLALLFAVYLLWTSTTYWVDLDTKALKTSNFSVWNTVVASGGLFGLGAFFLIPAGGIGGFVLRFVMLLLFYLVPLFSYVYVRNQKVADDAKVLTYDHIRYVLTAQLARLGIDVGEREKVEERPGAPVVFRGKSLGKDEDPTRVRQAESSSGFMAAKELVHDAYVRRSTDIHLEPKREALAVRYRIDGILHNAQPFERAAGDAIINIFKVLGGLDIAEKRKPQDGSFSAEITNREIDFRVASQGTMEGEKLSLRLLDKRAGVTHLSELGMREKMYEQIRAVVSQPHGLFIACGPTGAGKSTTLYAALREIDRYQRNVITVEDPIEYHIDNVTQIEINTKAGQSFGISLRSILRQDPDVIMIGEIRDEETAKIACQAATTGHMVFSTLHANDTITALFRLIDLGVEPFMLAAALSAVLSQRLVRVLCDVCKEPYKPKPDLLQKANLPPDKIDVFYRPPKNAEEGRPICAKCGGTGYYGRTGAFELLVITEKMRDLVKEKAAINAIKAEARKNGMLYLQEEGLRLVIRGVTSIQELMRVVK